LSTVLTHRHDLLAALYQAGGTDAVTNTAANSTTTSQTTGGQAFSTTSQSDTTYGGQEFRAYPSDNAARYLREINDWTLRFGCRKQRRQPAWVGVLFPVAEAGA
jgi:hypothetical protein